MDTQTNEFDRRHCPIVKAINLIGDKWILLILRECFMGVRRFEELHVCLDVSKSVLTVKLNKMLVDGLLKKTRYQLVGQRSRFEYRLTEKGRDLRKIFIFLSKWGNEYLVEDGQETIFVVDKSSGTPVEMALINKFKHLLTNKDIVLRAEVK